MIDLNHLCQTSWKHKGERAGQYWGCLKNAQRSGKEFREFRSVGISLLTPLESELGLWEQFISTLNKSACYRNDHYSLVIYEKAYWWIAVRIFCWYKSWVSFFFSRWTVNYIWIAGPYVLNYRNIWLQSWSGPSISECRHLKCTGSQEDATALNISWCF